MCTSPTTIYSCSHTKPDHIIEFCYADYEDDCGQVHPRFERLARRCPRCTRRAHGELERRTGIPAHGPHDEDARSSTRSSSPSSPTTATGEPQHAASTAAGETEAAAKVADQQQPRPAPATEVIPTAAAATAAPLSSPSPPPRGGFQVLCPHCGHAVLLLKSQPGAADPPEEAKPPPPAPAPPPSLPLPALLAKDSHTLALNALLAEHRRLQTTIRLQNELLAEGLTRQRMRSRNDRMGQEVRENEEELGKLAVEEGERLERERLEELKRLERKREEEMRERSESS
ncbi:hypothetical protein GTA08_BOTSDO10638 [Neofusicoccum parvum]|uniref:Uncharacterized protein n=1 Tax=Neofusicoccum parvum TaxID=310453 RepID=A0ACB5SDZ7_9PEZI|nr:hypothetical protein GTA08_BOTSDO10638 [Neofusicoccum parvum]